MFLETNKSKFALLLSFPSKKSKYLNSKFYDLYSNCYRTLGVCSTKEWAKVLFGNEKFLDELWII